MMPRRDVDAHLNGDCYHGCGACEAEQAADDAAGIYHCGMCDQRVDPVREPSPCEHHADPVCSECAPCDDCQDEAKEAAELDTARFRDWVAKGWAS